MRENLLSKRSILAILLLLFLGLALVNEYLYFIEMQHQRDLERESVLHQASTIRTALEREINTTLSLTMGLIVFVAANPDISEREFERIAEKLMQNAPTIRNIGLAKDNIISHIYPQSGNEAALGLDYMQLPSQKFSVVRAIETGKAVIAGPVDLVQGGRAFISRIPIYAGMDRSQYWGLASVVINIESFYKSSGLKADDPRLSIALRGKDGLGMVGQPFFGDAQLFAKESSIILPINLPVGSWFLAAEPRQGWDKSWGLPLIIRIVGLVISVIICGLIFLLLNFFKQVHYLALHDPLTGLMNRRLLDEHLQQSINEAQRREGSMAILYIDLDQFKPVNDNYGHKQGDHLLVVTAQRIRECLRSSDIIARMGGDEFIVILPDDQTRATAEHTAEKISRSISSPVELNSAVAVSVGVSIGVSIYPQNGESAEKLIRYADAAMYAVKSSRMQKAR